MKRNTKVALALISFFLLICEFFYGIPFLGGSFILGFGWQPLLINAFLYLILAIILLVDNQNAIKPMSIIPVIGFVGSFIAFIPIVGMFVHWVLFFLLVFFIFIVLSAPTYIRNKDAKVIYTQYKDDHSNKW
ncbi:hypothetical protein IDG47_16630 [Staphylococcus sp. EG-SA-6]|uniref:Uncharacterized protein n=2 Tax=Staphylococcus haemolyticus TaxID=1283 RepID=A0A2A1KDQ3_STAHA|nr:MULTISPECIES: hypothetical protein [Staphylococcus]KDP47645.1 hypothetical protein CO98_1590 [Staphylococcus aureus subsp. aureus CO-98]MBN4934334.1 hypothetical protein [Staphylococcus sp. EG-SA-6]MDU5815539.1 hypothetical protein [Staphylococcus sp.]AKC75567.1 hypothetical protein ShL2_00699 [Staphylococcus haemolyticus]AUV66859.1 hypothetical protein CUZ62_03665 [Staphylococcus haemolyticus]